jgi:hypothetical protein
MDDQQHALDVALQSLARADREAVAALLQSGEVIQFSPPVPRRVSCRFKIDGQPHHARLTPAQAKQVKAAVKAHPKDARKVKDAVLLLLQSLSQATAVALEALQDGLDGEVVGEHAAQPLLPPLGACTFTDGTCKELSQACCYAQTGHDGWQQGVPCPQGGLKKTRS